MAKSEGRPVARGGGLSMAAVPAGVDPTQAAVDSLKGSVGITRTATAYQQAIAVHKPRDLVQVTKDVLYEAEQMGEGFVYSWTVNDKNAKSGKSVIEGTSIEGAMVLFRNFGNCVLETDLVDETPSAWIFKSYFIDMEKGITVPRLFRQRKTGGPSGMQAGRAEDAAFSVGISKSQRNVIVLAMPGWLRDKAIEKSKDTAAKKYENVTEWAPKCIEYFKGIGVPESSLVDKLVKPVGAWSSRDILTLRIIAKSLADKETTIADEFPETVPADPAKTDGDGVVVDVSQNTHPMPSDEPFVQSDPVAQSGSATPEKPTGSPAPAATGPKSTVDWATESQLLRDRLAGAKGLAELGSATGEVESFAKAGAPAVIVDALRMFATKRKQDLEGAKGDKS